MIAWTAQLARALQSAPQPCLIVADVRDAWGDLCEVLQAALEAFRADLPVVTTWRGVRQLEERGVSAINWEEQLAPDERRMLDRFVHDLVHDWYRPLAGEATSLTMFEGEEYGAHTMFDHHLYLLPRLKRWQAMRALLRKNAVKSLIVVDDTGELAPAAALAAASNRCACFPITPVRTRSISWELQPAWRSSLGKLMSGMMDAYAWRRARRSNDETILLDSKFADVAPRLGGRRRVLLAPMESGVRLRSRILGRGVAYLSPFFVDRPTRRHAGRHFRSVWQRLARSSEFRDRFTLAGGSFWELSAPYLKRVYANVFPEAAGRVAFLSRAFRRCNVRAVVLRNDSRFLEQCCVAAARRSGAVSIALQHGVVAVVNYLDEGSASAVGFWGELERQRSIRRGNPPERCVVTGYPLHDVMKKDFGPGKEELAESLGLRADVPWVVLASQRPHRFSAWKQDDENLQLAAAVVAAQKEFPDHELLIKIHPYEDEVVFADIGRWQPGGRRVVVVKHFPLVPLLRAASVLLTLDSTVGLEAMLVDTPVLVINLTGAPDSAPYVAERAALGVYGAAEIGGTVHRALTDRELRSQLITRGRQFAQRYASGPDGQACARLLEVVDRLCAKPGGTLPGVTSEREFLR